MKIELVNSWSSTLPADDTHPYRTGWWQPNVREYNAFDLPVEGELPADLAGVYLRNTENPLHPSIGRYHPFDGDGMLHSLYLNNGDIEYRNRFVRTPGLLAEQQAAEPLWAGLFESPRKSRRAGCGARTALKDASSTDVVVHAGMAATTFYQCGDVFQLQPRTLQAHGSAPWVQHTTPGWGVSAHTKVDEKTGEMLFFNYSKQPPYMHYGVVDAQGELVHYVPIELPGPRLPHDMAFTEKYAILHDFPLFWDAEALRHDAHAVRFHKDMPSRFAVLPRRGNPSDIRWFEADPTFVLHVINAYDDGDDVVMDGFFQENPSPRIEIDAADERSLFRMLDTRVIGTKPYRWRMNMQTGQLSENFLHDEVAEFGMINPRHAGQPYRYTWAMETKPGWFVFDALTRIDVHTGQKQRYQFADGVIASESPMAPVAGRNGEDDGYVITYTNDLRNDESHAEIFCADDISQGPVARIRLPQRICAGTHSYWADIQHLQAG